MIRFTLFLCFLATSAFAQSRHETSAGPVEVQAVVTGIDEAWSVGFLPDGGFLVTQRSGALWHGHGGKMTQLGGVPQVWDNGQGGLLDVMVPRDFNTSRAVFLSFSQPDGGAARTAVARATLAEGATALTGVTVIFTMKNSSRAGQHFGSRLVEAPDGTIFVTIGDRGEDELAQDLNRHNGKVLRINRDGSIPADNPFATGGGLPEIWSYGHRNPQSAALDARGRLWTVEHGARGGDEVNLPQAGRNYGWPVISYGRHYSGFKIGEGTSKPGMEQPEFYWDPSIAPSGAMIYSGKLWPEWAGNLFVGSLKFDMISRLTLGGSVAEAERLLPDAYIRIRDVREAPDGSIWFISVGDSAVYRMRPL